MEFSHNTSSKRKGLPFAKCSWITFFVYPTRSKPKKDCSENRSIQKVLNQCWVKYTKPNNIILNGVSLEYGTLVKYLGVFVMTNHEFDSKEKQTPKFNGVM